MFHLFCHIGRGHRLMCQGQPYKIKTGCFGGRLKRIGLKGGRHFFVGAVANDGRDARGRNVSHVGRVKLRGHEIGRCDLADIHTKYLSVPGLTVQQAPQRRDRPHACQHRHQENNARPAAVGDRGYGRAGAQAHQPPPDPEQD